MGKATRIVADTGIYRTVVMEGGPDEESLREVVEAVCTAMAKRPKDLDGWLALYKTAAEGVLGKGETSSVKDAKDLLFYLDALASDFHGKKVQSAVWNAIQIGRLVERLRIRPFEPVVKAERKRELRRKSCKAESDAKRTELSLCKAQRARAMFREWYLNVPKRERPKKGAVIADIARRLNVEFPESPTTSRRVRDYLSSKNSGNL